jgi:hypothetical protein
MNSFVARAAWLPLCALGAVACGANVTPSGDDHFELTKLADFEETMGFKVGFAELLSFDQVADGAHICDLIDRGDGKSCYDDYSAKIYPDGVWRRYDIAFSSLTTGGWGYAHAFDQTRVYRIKFSLPPTTRYDLLLDDAAFYTKVFD